MSPSSHARPTIANRKIRECFTLRRATRYGGFNLLSDFVRAQGIDRAFEEAFGRDKAPWATYALPESLRHLLDGHLLGLERIWHFEELEQEPLLCLKRGRERLPNFTLLYRELARFDTPEKLGRLRGVGERLVRQALATQGWYVLDFDSTVETLYGEQEGARLGPNPHKPGRPSYHPLLCRELLVKLSLATSSLRATRSLTSFWRPRARNFSIPTRQCGGRRWRSSGTPSKGSRHLSPVRIRRPVSTPCLGKPRRNLRSEAFLTRRRNP